MSVSLEDLRRDIDSVDQQLVTLLGRRAELVRDIGHLKAEAGTPVFDPGRERDVLERVTALNPGPYDNDHIQAIYREIMAASRSLEEPARVGYLGPPHTFSHQAAQQYFGRLADLTPLSSFSDIFDFVDRSPRVAGVVPIENTTSGTIGETLDLFVTRNVHIQAEIQLPVSHNLLATADLTSWTCVYSHPHAIAQCRSWIQRHLGTTSMMEVASTAEAARRAAEEPTTAAIGPLSAAEAFGLEVLRQDIQDVASNRTRFYVIGDTPAARTGRDKMALMVAVHDRVGALHDVLSCLRAHDLNLSFIQSRPSRLKPDDYIFFLEMMGHPDEDAVQQALRVLGESTVLTRVLGAWPVEN
ncbi:MAG: prephenate dehydratase [Chloroflexi bacterium]|nr:prephenate dehydratase [Chloroflexota bacterium]MCY3959556.1 prephenate dehydratase [Chloroflexota bacterium]